MKTTIENNYRVYQVVDSLSRQYFCNIEELNKVINENELRPGYFKIYHFWNNKAKRVSKKDLKSFFEGAELTQEFIY
jgi:hypothetical protein